jgi:hypothetical protein
MILSNMVEMNVVVCDVLKFDFFGYNVQLLLLLLLLLLLVQYYEIDCSK